MDLGCLGIFQWYTPQITTLVENTGTDPVTSRLLLRGDYSR